MNINPLKNHRILIIDDKGSSAGGRPIEVIAGSMLKGGSIRFDQKA